MRNHLIAFAPCMDLTILSPAREKQQGLTLMIGKFVVKGDKRA